MARNLTGLREIAKKLNRDCRKRLGRDVRFLPALILMTDDTRLPDPRAAMKALERGSAVIFRHYDDPKRQEHTKDLRAIARDHQLLFLVAGDADLAARVKADGCHLPENLLPLAADLKAKHPGLIITTSAHSESALLKAEAAEVDACLLSPIFATDSHTDAPTLGADVIHDLVVHKTLPIYGLGGITDETAPLLIGSGLAGFAAIGALAK